MTTPFTPTGGGNTITLEDFAGYTLPVTANGADSTGVADSTTALSTTSSNSHEVILPNGTYKASGFPTDTNHNYIGLGNVTLNFFESGGNPVYGALVSGSNYENLLFNGAGGDITYTYIEVTGTNIHAKRCGFTNFLNPTGQNAWGNLIESAYNVTLDHCTYGSNTQSDIALTDSNTDITIINPYNPSGVVLDIEPTTGTGTNGLNCIGGHYATVYGLEAVNTAYASKNCNFVGCRIDSLHYNGTGMNFRGCDVSAIVPGDSGGNLYSGQLMIDSLDLGPNLITDPYLFDIAGTDTNCFWTEYASSSVGLRKQDAIQGKYLSLNPPDSSQQVIFTTRNYITATAGQAFIGFIRNRCKNAGTGAAETDHVAIQWFDSSNNLLRTDTVQTTRCAVNADSGWVSECFVCQAPTSTAKLKFRVANNYGGNNTADYYVSSVGLFTFSQNPSGLGNMPAVIGALSQPNFNNVYYQNHGFQSTLQYYAGGLIGEIIIQTNPVVGQSKGWVCTALPSSAGYAGTWTSLGNL